MAIARRIAPFFNADSLAIELHDVWGRRGGWTLDDLLDIAAAAKEADDAARKERERQHNAGPSLIGYRPRPRRPKRETMTKQIEAIQRELGIKRRWAYELARDGTDDAGKAAVLAKHLGGNPEDHMRHARRRPGRRRNYRTAFFRIGADFTYRDYALANDDFNGLTDAMRIAYQRGPSPPHSFESFDEFDDYVRANGLPCEDDLVRLAWMEYRHWRISQVVEIGRAICAV